MCRSRSYTASMMSSSNASMPNTLPKASRRRNLFTCRVSAISRRCKDRNSLIPPFLHFFTRSSPKLINSQFAFPSSYLKRSLDIMADSQTRTFPLNSLSGLELHNVQAELVTYRGRQAVRVIEQDESMSAIAILTGSDFQDGV